MSAQAWRGLILTVVIALAAGFIGARLGAQASSGATPAASPGGGQGSVRESVGSLLRRDFRLTPDQKARVAAIDAKFTRDHNMIWADIRASNVELAAAVANDMSLNQEAKNAITEIQESVGRLQTRSIQYVLEVRQVLNPDQRAEFDEHIIMALMRDPA